MAESCGRRGSRVTIYRMRDALHGFMGLGTGYIHVRRAQSP